VQEGYPAVRATWREEAPRLTQAVLVAHGTSDRVVIPELSRELAGLLERRGPKAKVKLLLYPGDHGLIPIDDIAAFLDANMRRP
jgi:dienelactone hydrolase